MKTEINNKTTSSLELICKIIMVILGLIIAIFTLILNIEYCYTDKGFQGLKKYISMYGDYGIPQLITTFLITLTAQVYLEQLKLSKVIFQINDSNENRRLWNEKVDLWLYNNKDLSDLMRNTLLAAKPKIYYILNEKGMKIPDETTLSQILSLFTRGNLILFETQNSNYNKNESRYYLNLSGYTCDSFYQFLFNSSDEVYPGAIQQCNNWYNQLLPKEPWDLPNVGPFMMLQTDDI